MDAGPGRGRRRVASSQVDGVMSEQIARAATQREKPFLGRFGPLLVTVALCVAVFTLLVFADYTPIAPTSAVVASLFLVNLVIILTLIGMMATEAWRLFAARRAHAAGARLHIRIVGMFSIIAAAPALLLAFVGWVTLDRTINPAFMQDVRGFVYNTAEAARLFRESQCRALLQETSLTALDTARARQAFDSNRPLFDDFLASRAKFLSFTVAALVKPDGTVLEKVTPPRDAPQPTADVANANASAGDTLSTGLTIAGPNAQPPAAATAAAANAEPVELASPEASDFEDARRNEPTCLILGEGRTFVALRAVPDFPDTFLYAARQIDPFAVEFPAQAVGLITLYEVYNAHRRNIQIAFTTMYVLIALVMMLSATWTGLSFANRLVTPIRRLMAATNQVSSGNLYVQVPVNRREGDLATLGDTFNQMTSELRLQQNRLVAATQTLEERRAFTEAVLAGVPAAIIGVARTGRITVVNPSAAKLVGDEDGGVGPIGRKLVEALPELASILEEAQAQRSRMVQGQITLSRGGRERLYDVRVANPQGAKAGQSFVLTLDDITDLVAAQRTSAWADVARRIAHEIKNPLTPIQLSAERLKRKYGRVITQDRDIFDQCTDTIVRQVEDIKRMVDEFSSFARMPKARLQEDDLGACVHQVVFLMRVAHPEIDFVEDLPPGPTIARFDRRLLSQALTNVVKNATEGLEGGAVESPRIVSRLAIEGADAVLEVIDNGKGFPVENRQSLLEPYVTTRAEGTGLGLPIVAKILEDHGGGLDLLDAPDGRGARVRMRFPIAGADAETAATKAVEANQG